MPAAKAKASASRAYKPVTSVKRKPYVRQATDTYTATKKVYKEKSISKDFALNYLSPWYSSKAPADSDSFGNFTTLNAVSRNTLTTSTTQDTIMVYSPSNQGLYSLMVWTADGSVAGDLNNTPNRQFISSPPDISRTLRGGLRIRNLTTSQNVGGITGSSSPSCSILVTGSSPPSCSILVTGSSPPSCSILVTGSSSIIDSPST